MTYRRIKRLFRFYVPNGFGYTDAHRFEFVHTFRWTGPTQEYNVALNEWMEAGGRIQNRPLTEQTLFWTPSK